MIGIMKIDASVPRYQSRTHGCPRKVLNGDEMTLTPPDNLGPPQREVFATLALLAGRAAAVRRVALIPGDSLLLARVAELVVRAREDAEAGRLADAVAFGDLAQELARNYWLTVPASLLPAVGRA